MKTLKQRGSTIVEINELSTDYKYDNSIWVRIEAVKEWLQELKNNLDKKSFDYPISASTIQKLIEELKQ